MTVYVVLAYSGPDMQVVGVYSTKEVAEQVCEAGIGVGWELDVVAYEVLDRPES